MSLSLCTLDFFCPPFLHDEHLAQAHVMYEDGMWIGANGRERMPQNRWLALSLVYVGFGLIPVSFTFVSDTPLWMSMCDVDCGLVGYVFTNFLTAGPYVRSFLTLTPALTCLAQALTV